MQIIQINWVQLGNNNSLELPMAGKVGAFPNHTGVPGHPCKSYGWVLGSLGHLRCGRLRSSIWLMRLWSVTWEVPGHLGLLESDVWSLSIYHDSLCYGVCKGVLMLQHHTHISGLIGFHWCCRLHCFQRVELLCLLLRRSMCLWLLVHMFLPVSPIYVDMGSSGGGQTPQTPMGRTPWAYRRTQALRQLTQGCLLMLSTQGILVHYRFWVGGKYLANISQQ